MINIYVIAYLHILVKFAKIGLAGSWMLIAMKVALNQCTLDGICHRLVDLYYSYFDFDLEILYIYPIAPI
jgi:hypothetical protein